MENGREMKGKPVGLRKGQDMQNGEAGEKKEAFSGNAPAKKRTRKRTPGQRILRALRSFLLKTLALALVLYILFFHIVGVTTVRTGDMYPRIDAGDLALFYRLDESWRAQDVVVIDKAVDADYFPVYAAPREKAWWRKALDFLKIPDPEDPPVKRFVCRVVAAPGDSVEVTEDGRLIVNGNAMIESGIFYRTNSYVGYTEYPIRLGNDEYFVMADFRNGGVDSRFFGPVRKEEIQGTVITVVRRNNL